MPVAIILARGQVEDRQVADRLVGADAYLPKAYKEDELLDLVHSLLQVKQDK